MNNIHRRTPALLLLALAVPLFAATREIAVGGTAPAAAAGWRFQPAAASNGDQFFAAWLDGRSGSMAIVGTRVTRDGQVLDPLGIRLQAAPDETGLLQPNVVWDGSAYLVLWTAMTWQNGISGPPRLYAARVDAEGRLATAPRVIVERGTVRDAASNGSVTVVVYASVSGEARTVILDGQGHPVGQETLPSLRPYRTGFTIAATGTGFVVAWSSNPGSNDIRLDRVEAIRLDAGGRAAGEVVIAGDGTAPSIAGAGSRVAIAWHRYTSLPPNGGGYILQARALDADLANAGPEQTLLTGYLAGPPAVFHREGRFEIVTHYQETSFWDSPLEVRAIALDANGAATGSRTLATLSRDWPGDVAAATNGAELLLARSTNAGQVVAHVAHGETVAAPVLLSWSGNAHRNPSLAASPAGHLVGWTEDDGVYATRIDGNGNSLDGRGMRLSTSSGAVRAGFDGTHYVLAWLHDGRAGVRWIAPLSGATVAETGSGGGAGVEGDGPRARDVARGDVRRGLGAPHPGDAHPAHDLRARLRAAGRVARGDAGASAGGGVERLGAAGRVERALFRAARESAGPALAAALRRARGRGAHAARSRAAARGGDGAGAGGGRRAHVVQPAGRGLERNALARGRGPHARGGRPARAGERHAGRERPGRDRAGHGGGGYLGRPALRRGLEADRGRRAAVADLRGGGAGGGSAAGDEAGAPHERGGVQRAGGVGGDGRLYEGVVPPRAHGRRAGVPARRGARRRDARKGGPEMTMRRALLFVLLATTLPLFAEPAEVPVGGTAFTRAPGRHEQPASASNGDQFFVAWTDRRSDTPAIVGTRVTREGRVLDPLGIRLSPREQVANRPHVAWDGGAYLVVWSASPWGFVSPDVQSIYAARVDASGLLVMAPRAIAERGTAHAVASNGNVSVVVAGSRTIVLDRDANVLARETLPAIWQNQSGFTIGRAGSGFVAAWSANPGSFPRDNTIQAVALNADGRIAGGSVNAGNGTSPSVATDGTRVMIAWHRHTVQPGGFTLHARPFDADLTNGGLLQTVHEGSSIVPPILIRRESRYEIIAAYDTFLSPHASALQVRAIKLAPDGRMTGWFLLGTLPPNVPGDVAAASNGVEMLLTTVARPWTGDLADVQARVVRGHEPEAPVLLSWSGNAQRNPSLASSPSGHIAAWTEDDGVYAARLDANGNSLDKRGVRLSTGRGRAYTAFDGTHYVVAWQHEDRIGVRRLAPLSGRTVAAAEVALEEVPTDPAFSRVELALVASPQATYVVTAQDRVRVTRIPHTTYRPDAAPLAVSPEGMQVERPDAAWNGSTLLVVWSEWHIPPRTNPPFPVSIRIHAARVSAGLTLLDPASLVIAEADEFSAFGAPSVASNGADWLVVAPKNGYQIVARRVLQNGTLESTGPAWIAHGDLADVAWNGDRYVLAWSRAAENERLGRLYTAEVPARGTLVATRRTPVSDGIAFGIPSVTAKSVAYTKYSFRPEHTGVARTFLRDHGAGQP